MHIPARTTLALATALLVVGCSSNDASSSDTAPQDNSTSTSAMSNSSRDFQPSTETTRPAPDTDPASQVNDTAYQNNAFIEAEVTALENPEPTPPDDLQERIAAGGLVIVHRYTGSGGSGGDAIDGSIDDGQRISNESTDRMRRLGEVYSELGANISSVLSSQYYFVYQHALAAMGEPVLMNRDLTGSLDFDDDDDELSRSLQGLRNRTVTPPPEGTNTVLFTHQGKFDKAYGYYLNAGQTVIFAPDGSGTPQVIASLPLEDWLALAN